jgi:membrane protein YdbS with pleckstrin-like domain
MGARQQAGAEPPAGEESVRFRTRLHPIAFSGAVGLAAFIALATGLVIRNNELPPPTQLRIALVGGLLAVAALVPATVRWRTAEFVLTTHRLRLQVRSLRLHRVELPLHEVAAVEVSASWLGSRLGYGALHVGGASGVVETFAPLARVREFREAIVSLTQRLRGAGRPR